MHADLIVTADALRSIDVLRWSEGKLTLVARDHSSLWPVAMDVLDSESTLVAEVCTPLSKLLHHLTLDLGARESLHIPFRGESARTSRELPSRGAGYGSP